MVSPAELGTSSFKDLDLLAKTPSPSLVKTAAPAKCCCHLSNSREQQPVSHSGGAHGELRAFDQTRETEEERSGGIDTN